MAASTQLVCSGCGKAVDPGLHVFACPAARAGDDIDHVLVRHFRPDASRHDAAREAHQTTAHSAPTGCSFVRYRHHLHSYQQAVVDGLSDDGFCARVRRIDDRIFELDRRRFDVTPLTAETTLAEALGLGGALWVKNETGNVSGSHKARHMMGLALHLEGGEATGRLAIASCGNAALAASVVARAIDRPLDVFIPTDADPLVVERLEALGANTVRCPRLPGQTGDPCYHRFQEAVASGAFPFSCQGSDNGLTIEGGLTLGYELSEQLAALGDDADLLFVQVGGAALASAVVQGLFEAQRLDLEAVDSGLPFKMPKVVTVQTHGAFPLARAYHRLSRRLLQRLEGVQLGAEDLAAVDGASLLELYGPANAAQNLANASRLMAAWGSERMSSELSFAATHRASFMWAWEDAPHSVAHGILDDETYDWFAVVKGMLRSGGFPLLVDEATLVQANALAVEHTGIPVDPTGSSGFAGLLALHQASTLPEGARSLVLFTGVDRAYEAKGR